MEFDLENPLTNFHDLHSESFPSLFLIESDHMPSLSYSKSLKSSSGFCYTFRREAVSSILQVSCSFDPFLSYLAVNYLDRFLSNQGMPQQQRPWAVRLLGISCVSLAVKMMNRTAEFSLNDIQGNGNNGGIIFDTQTIQRMEALILGALKWRMRSITPFSFLSFFIRYFKLKDPPLKQALQARATQTIIRAQNEGKLVGLKASVIAASALLSACHELFPLQFSCFREAVVSCSYVNKEMMGESYKEMQELAMEEYESVMDRVSTSDTPVNVLDRHFLCSSSSSSSQEEAEAEHMIEEEEEVKQKKIGTIASSSSSSSATSSSSISSSCCSTIGEAVEDDIMMMMKKKNHTKRRKITATAATSANYCYDHSSNNDATTTTTTTYYS